MASTRVAATILFIALAQKTHAKRQGASAVQANFETEHEAEASTGDHAEVAALEVGAGVEASLPQTAGWSGWLKHLFAGVSTAILVKVCCLTGNVLVHVSPFSKVQEWEAKGSTGDTDPSPYVSIGLGGWQWCTYGFAAWAISNNDRFLVLVYANCLGALLGSYYTGAFYRVCRDPHQQTKLRRYLSFIGSMLTLQITLWLVLPQDRALIFHGFAAAFCSFLTACSLLVCLPTVVHTGDTSGICGPLVLANFFGAVVWAYWGYIMGDPAIIGPNVFGACSSVACLYVKGRYGSAIPEPECEDLVCEAKLGDAWGIKRKYERKSQPTKVAATMQEPPPTEKRQETAAPGPVEDAQPMVEVK